MSLQVIDAGLMQRAFLAGAKGLEAKKEWINELNVFPVPDGDTGTNMTMTIMAAAKEVASMEEPTIDGLAKAISSGSLRGARGNSGVILSQLFRGFAKEIKGHETIDVDVLAASFNRAAETAYKAVMKPKEGTILTVARGMADKALEVAEQTEDILVFAEKVIEHGDYVLSQTPEMLPVLKQAGVVDSGGQGLMQVLKGVLDGLKGKEVDMTVPGAGAAASSGAAAGASEIDTADIKFGYCTEFIINVEKNYDEAEEQHLKAYLESIGDSIVVVSDDDVVKVHVHTNDPGLAIQKALTYGSLSRMKIDNMREEHQERLIQNAEQEALRQKEKEQEEKQEPRKANGFIAVSVGEGLGEIFRGIGVDYLIEGGQTMNPSTEDMLRAIEEVNAETIYILPNNKNIILAANQAKLLTKDKEVIVIPTKTVPQGITAVVTYSAEASVEENTEAMSEEIKNVKTGQITYAVRDTHIDDKEIHEGDIMGIGDHEILAVGKEIQDVTLETIALMDADDAELITVYYGEDTKAEDAEKLEQALTEKYPSCDVEVYAGGQPIYYYVVSVE